jgi:septum formation protein
VVLDDEILGKPKDEQDALRMLLALSDREHEVITGVSLVKGKKSKTFHVATKVKFYEITYSEALRYIKTGEPMDKAGAYGIQGKGCVFVESINGDFYNVVGLPIAKVVKELKRFQEEG